jgi:acyl carrier protein
MDDRFDPPLVKLRQWIIDQGIRRDAAALQPDTNLLKEGYLDSLALMGMIVYVEKLRGEALSEQQMSAQSFASLRNIEQAFFNHGAPMAPSPQAHGAHVAGEEPDA